MGELAGLRALCQELAEPLNAHAGVSHQSAEGAGVEFLGEGHGEKESAAAPLQCDVRTLMPRDYPAVSLERGDRLLSGDDRKLGHLPAALTR